MKFGIRAKLILVVALLFIVGALINTVIPTVFYDRALYSQLHNQAEEIADLVQGMHLSSTEASEVAETMLDNQLVNTAQILAMLYATGELDQSMVMEIARTTDIDEIYITDGDGVTLLSNNVDGIGWRFPDDPEAQAYPFRALLNSDTSRVTQEVTFRDIDGQAFKFVGVSRIDAPGIVQVGASAESLNQLINAIGMQANIEMVASDDEIVYAYVIDGDGLYQYHPNQEMVGQRHQEISVDNAYDYQVVINEQGDTLVLGISMDEFLSAQGDALRMTILSAIVLVGVVIVIIAVWSGTFVRSIQALIARIQTLASGDFTVEIESANKDEIGNAFFALGGLKDDVGNMLGNALSTSESLAAASGQLAAATEQTSASIEEVASTSNQFAGTVEQISGNATAMTNAVQAISERAVDGEQAIEDSVVKTTELKQRISELADSVNGLGERSREVGSIVELISDIADQTNLLALNAAIEAARAGEHGRGFAVVAEEVRALAEQSADAANKISQLIYGIQTEADQAVRGISESAVQADANAQVVSESGGVLNEILQAMESVIEEVPKVSNGIQELGFGSQQLAAATEEQSATMEEVASLASNLSNMSEGLQEFVKHFKI